MDGKGLHYSSLSHVHLQPVLQVREHGANAMCLGCQGISSEGANDQHWGARGSAMM